MKKELTIFLLVLALSNVLAPSNALAGYSLDDTDALYFGVNPFNMKASPLTICASINPVAVNATRQFVVLWDAGGGNQIVFRQDAGAANGALGFSRNWSTQQMFRRTIGGIVTAGVWNIVCVTHDGSASASAVHMYVNGVEASAYGGDLDGSGTERDSNGKWTASIDISTAGLVGIIANIGVWNRELNGSELTQIGSGKSPLCSQFATGLKWAPSLEANAIDTITSQGAEFRNTPTLSTHPTTDYCTGGGPTAGSSRGLLGVGR